MALSYRQRKQRATLFSILAVLAVLIMVFGKMAVEYITGPKIPGYATAVPAGTFADLDWKVMLKGHWEYGEVPFIPASVQPLAGKPVRLKGFLLPLHKPGISSEFFLAPKPRGCYFCNPPGASEIAQINIAGGKELQPTSWPVTVFGTLKLATAEGSGQVLYTLDNVVMMAGR